MHIVYAVAPGGGPEAYVRTLAPWLTARGHRVSLVASAPLAAPFDGPLQLAPVTRAHYYLARAVGGFRAWPLRVRAWEQSAAIARAVRRIAAQHPVDLVELPEGLPAAPFERRWPLVVRAHGADWTFRRACGDGARARDPHLIRQEATQLRAADVVAPLSQDLAMTLSACCRFPRERMRVVPYPIDVQQFAPCPQDSTVRRPDTPTLGHSDTPGSASEQACIEAGVHPGRSAADAAAEPLILSIGRLEPRKGTDVLVQAMQHVWQAYPGARLHLLGRATHFTPAALLALVPAAKRAQVVFPGFVARSALPAYYRAASVYATATQYETFAYTVLEALASGLPVVAAQSGAIPELIVDGMNGVLLPRLDARALGESIVCLLSDPARMARLGGEARESAYPYDLARVGPQHEALYGSALETYAHRAR